MSDLNLDIIQNKIDALVEKVIQQEQSNEDIRVTYAQILERINTKIDVLSDTENFEKLAFISMEIRDAINKRQEIVDGKFSAIKGEFDRVNDILIESFQSKDVVSAYERMESSITKQQEENKKKYEEILNFIETFNELETTNDTLKTNFAIIKEQNTIASENFAKQIESLKSCNQQLEDGNNNIMKNFESVLFTLQEFSDSLNDDFSEIKEFISEKINDTIEKIHETDSFIELLNTNLSTLIEVVGSLFENEEFLDLQSDVADILTKISYITESLKKVSDKDDIYQIKIQLNELEQSIADKASQYSREIKTVKEEIIKEISFRNENSKKELEETLLKSAETAKEIITEEVTDVLSEESIALSNQLDSINTNVTDSLNTLQQTLEENSKDKTQKIDGIISDLETKNTKLDEISETSDKIEIKVHELKTSVELADKAIEGKIEELDDKIEEFDDKIETTINNKFDEIDNKIEEMNSDIVDVISTESVAASEQIQNIAQAVGEFKTSLENITADLSEEILNKQNETINNAINALQSKFVTQLVQIADNISFEDETMEINDLVQDCTDEIKAQIASDISGIKQEISLIRDVSGATDENLLSILEKVETAVKNDLSNDIKALSSGFKILTTGLRDEKDYVYTLPDIESDLSKIRLDLSRIQNSIIKTDAETIEAGEDIATKINSIKETLCKLENSSKDSDIANIKELFTSLNEDVSSISKRTNKLILASDEVSKTLNNNISSFTSVMKTFERQSHDFYNSSILKDLNSKVNSVAQTSNSISQSNKILNEAFMYLAEWIDSASETFEDITGDITVIKEKVQAPEEETERLSRNLKSLSIIVEEQDSKLEDLEEKIEAIDEKLNKIISAQNDAKETKSLLEYIASQISLANEKIIENEKLALKMASMDKQLKKIEKNIAIITEYIDEEDDEYDEDNEFYDDEEE